MSQIHELQKLIRLYREETGSAELDMHDVAMFCFRKGWPMPTPKRPVDMMAAQLRDAARQDVRKDVSSGRPYRAYHAVPAASQGSFYWIDIDDPETTFANMRKSMVRRREQMVDDGVQLSLDLDHWNSIRPGDEHIALPMDLELDIEWRKNAMDVDDDKKAG
ncbi:MAG: hypothetical protein ABW128_20010 [Rhizorhabdus sp.]